MLIYGIAAPEAAAPLWSALDPGPVAAFHLDNKELPAARTGSLLNEISYQSANSCEFCLAVRSGYESPRAALDSYRLKGKDNEIMPFFHCMPASLTLWSVATNGRTPATQEKEENLNNNLFMMEQQLSAFIFTGGIWSSSASSNEMSHVASVVFK